MPPRISPSSLIRCARRSSIALTTQQHSHYATAAAATAPSSIADAIAQLSASVKHHPTQPPSLKPANLRKTQLIRQYTSLLQTTPLMLVFQHNNLSALEWIALRRELDAAMQRVDQELAASGSTIPALEKAVKLQVVQTGLLSTAIRLAEYYNPATVAGDFKHVLSREAHAAIAKKTKHPLTPLLAGPVALLTFPTVSPVHLKAAISVLAPSPPAFPAPLRRIAPGWHELTTQLGVQKLMLLGARVEDKVFDTEGAKYVGSIPGGLDGLRAQLVASLQGIGANLANTVDGAGRSLYFTLESRKIQMEDEAKGEGETKSDA